MRIYQSGQYRCGDEIELSITASQHVGVVLRMQPGQCITLFCGDNREFLATITSVSRKKVLVRIDAEHYIDRESPCSLHLAQAISKGERMEFVVQKAVELGVASITPLMSAHSVVRLDADRLAKKQAQWQAIAIAACEQSGRNQIPMIYPVCTFDYYVQHCNEPIKWTLDPSFGKSWRDYPILAGDMALLIGPEGGFREDERQLALQQGFLPLSLGPRVLRTETAAIAALSVLQAVCGDL